VNLKKGRKSKQTAEIPNHRSLVLSAAMGEKPEKDARREAKTVAYEKKKIPSRKESVS